MSVFSKDFSGSSFFRCHEALVFNNCELFNSAKFAKTFESVDNEVLFKQCVRCNVVSFSPVWYYFHKKKCNSNLNPSLRKTKSKIPTFQCDHCKYKTRFRHNLSRHQIRRHASIEQKNLFQCPHCDFASSTNLYLKGHIMRMHTSVESQKKTVILNHCDKCDFKTTYKRNLQLHKQQMHAPKHPQQSFQCAHCEYTTSLKQNILRHTRNKHTPMEFRKSFQCENCDYKTFCKQSLKNHITSKHPRGKPQQVFQCRSCDYKTTKEAALANHVDKLHSQPLSLQCDKCEFTTSLQRLLVAHQKIHTFFAQQKWDQSDQYAFKSLKKTY